MAVKRELLLYLSLLSATMQFFDTLLTISDTNAESRIIMPVYD